MTAIKEWMAAGADRSGFGFDHAELVTFNSMVTPLPSFDARTNVDLETAGFEAGPARERERAVWELAYREPPLSPRQLTEFYRREPDRQVRWNYLWLARKVCHSECMTLLQLALQDDDIEVREHARVHISELTGRDYKSEHTKGVYLRGTPFDQTLPLEIAGFAVVDVGGVDLRVVLSPLWFAHIQGRVMACTRDDTFMRDLIIEKRYAGFHPDGSDHFEIYPFAGKSWRVNDKETEHRYLSAALHPIYLSGRVEEDPENVIWAPVAAGRAATTTGRLIQTVGTDGAVEQIAERRIVSNVKGQYFGWAHASLKHYMAHGDILPGTVQLVAPTHPETVELINTYICGTFRGKASDYNGDACIDINEISCHGTTSGELDYLADGSSAGDPFA